MFIPSTEIYDLIVNEQVGVWSEKYDDDHKAALMVKVTGNIIRAVVGGCKLELIVGIVHIENGIGVLCFAVNVHDTVDSPLLVVMPPRLDLEKEGLLNLLSKNEAKIVLLNELSHSVCSGIGRLEPGLKSWSEKHISSDLEIDTPKSTVICNEVIDSFSCEVNEAYRTVKKYDSDVCCVALDVELFDTLIFQSYESKSSISYDAISSNPGLIQEEQIEHIFSALHGVEVYLSPEVQIGKKTRELTDVFANSHNTFYLIESKAVVFETSEVSIERKMSKILKLAKKAIGQLEGAMKVIRRSESIHESDGEVIEVPSDAKLHGVVLVSEFYELVTDREWEDVMNKIYNVYSATQGMIHVMDTSEFYYILNLSQNSYHNFNSGMMKIFNLFYEYGRLDIRCIDSSLPHL